MSTCVVKLIELSVRPEKHYIIAVHLPLRDENVWLLNS